MTGRSYVLVEGHGEELAVLNLLNRLTVDLEIALPVWATPIRGLALHTRAGLTKYAERVRRSADARSLLVLRDDEDACPAATGPEASEWLRELRLPFPSAVVMAYREYESLFLASLPDLAGKELRDETDKTRPGISADFHFPGNPEQPRGVKELLSRAMPPGKRYKPTIDQLPLTRLVNFARVRASGLSWFGTLERALHFLAAQQGYHAMTYPPAAQS